jgi:hypothetical protein
MNTNCGKIEKSGEMLRAAVISDVEHAWGQYLFEIVQWHASSQRDHGGSVRDVLKHLIHGLLVGFTANQDNRHSMAFDEDVDETCKISGRPLLD